MPCSNSPCWCSIQNQLTGEIPATLGAIAALKTVDLAENMLHGTIPSTVTQLGNCTGLFLNDNYLSGSIPSTVGNMYVLIYLYLDNNALSGSVPVGVSQLSFLTSIFLQDNVFSGSLDGVFNSANQRFLNVIQLSHNQFTGNLPAEAFQLQILETFVAVSNCFIGTLSASICNGTRIRTLALDGLRSASRCRRFLLPGMSNAYTLPAREHNQIPSCLFSMRALNTLNLRANGLTGTLPSDVNISATLVDFAVSHNRLTGTIPKIFQTRSW